MEIVKLTVLGLATTLLFVSIAGISHAATMQLNERGEMSGCIFTGKIMLCKMNVVEHISLWQNMLTAAPQKINLLVLLLLAVFTIGFFILNNRLLNFLRQKHFHLRQCPNRQQNNILFNSLKYAFAKGILHPRIYELAIL